MRIWFELANFPHINMFAAMIRDLEKEHEVIITCRPFANAIEYLDLNGFNYEVVGQDHGDTMVAKILGYPVLVMQLCNFILTKKIDIAISQCSYHSPTAARLCGIPSIYMTDNVHSIENNLAFLCADTIMVPEFLNIDKLKAQYSNHKKIVFYPGVKEGLYLWDLEKRMPTKNISPQKQRQVYIRPGSWTANNHTSHPNHSNNRLDDLILGMKDHVDIIVLPRGKEQDAYYRDIKFNGVQVESSPLDIANIVTNCDLFIGAGRIMTREMAVLGIPTISVHPDELFGVDKHLLDADTFFHAPNLTAVQALQYLELTAQKTPNRSLLQKGKSAYDLVKNTILNGYSPRQLVKEKVS